MREVGPFDGYRTMTSQQIEAEYTLPTCVLLSNIHAEKVHSFPSSLIGRFFVRTKGHGLYDSGMTAPKTIHVISDH